MRIGNRLRVLILSALIPTCGTAQTNDPASACASPDAVLQRYVDAVGGNAVYNIQSRTMTAKESEGDERYVYKFKWKAPNRVTAGFTPYLLNILPLSYPNGTWIFDGEAWSNVFSRKTGNEDSVPEWQRRLRHTYPYNESPFFLMFRVVADPLMMTRAHELYSSFEVDRDFAGHPGVCVLRAHGIDEWRYKREDILTFDAVSGLLRTWKIQAGVPPNKIYVQFKFEDYRQIGAVKFPFSVYFDFYKAMFRYSQVVNNKILPDSDFVAKLAKP